jgi:hypothetical protein
LIFVDAPFDFHPAEGEAPERFFFGSEKGISGVAWIEI